MASSFACEIAIMVRSRCSWSRASPDVGLQDAYEFSRALCPTGRRLLVGIDDVRAHVPLEELDEQTAHATAAGDQLLEDLRTVSRVIDALLDGVELPANPAYAVQESLFVFTEVGHVIAIPWGVW